MGADILKEYLVALGIQDNFSDKLNSVLKNSSQQIQTFAKGFAIANSVVGTALVTANVGIAKFLVKLVNTNDEVKKFAKETKTSETEAFRLKSTLDAMGKSMDEVKASPELTKTFKQLQNDAAGIQIPDMTEGLTQVREIQTEFTRLKQSGTYAIQWVGHYLMKYIYQPLQKIKENFSGLNDTIIKNIPKWSEKAGAFLAGIVRLGAAVIRGAAALFKAIKRIFDFIPNELKIVGAALSALALFVRAGPIGKLIAIISLALLLLEDFYTYIDGGDSLLGGLWQRLIDIWDLLNDSGAIDRFKDGFKNALDFAKNKLMEAKDYLVELYSKFRESSAIEKFIELLKNIKELFVQIAEPVVSLGSKIITAFTGTGKNALDWFITKGLPDLVDFLSNAVGFIANLIEKLNDMGLTEPIIIGIVTAFAGLKVIDGITNSVKKLTGFIEGINKAQKAVGRIQELKNAFGSLRTAINTTKLAQEAHNLILMLSAVRTGGLVAAQTALAGAEGSSTVAKVALTAATTAWNVAASIGTTVTTAFGTAVAFLTSPIGLVVLAVASLIAVVVLLVRNWDKVKEFFIKLWAKIKETFSGVDKWFKEKFKQAKDNVIEAFHNIAEWFGEKFQEAKDKIIDVFSSIGGWFQARAEDIRNGFLDIPEFLGNKFDHAKEKVRESFAPVVNWFKSRVKDITGAFKNIPKDFRDKFFEAVNKIKEVFSPLVDWFEEKVDAIKGFFNGIGDKVKSVFVRTPDNPTDNPTTTGGGGFSSGGGFGSTRGYANGGIVNKEQVAHIAEGNKPEAIIPLTKPTRAKELISGAMNYLGMDTTEKLSAKVNALIQFVHKASSMLNTMNTGLSQPTSYLYTTSNHTVDNRSYDMRTSYAIHDSSGRPEAVVNAVDRSSQIRLRNLQGILNA